MTAAQPAPVDNPRPVAGINFDPMTLADPTHVDRVHRDAVLSEVDPASVALPPARAPLKNHTVVAGVTELLSAYSSGSLQPSQLLDQLKARIEAARTGGEAVLRFAPDAEQAARESDRRIAEGRARPLEGIPFGVKDIIDVAGTIVTSGSHFTGDRVAAVDAPVVAALRAAGAITFAITATTEFATGSPYNPRYGTVTNPHDRRRWTGGSSTGSGAALAARLMPLALGTDTGGSIRVPSCWCGTTGLKPSRELISRQGVAPLSWTLDHVGPMARSAEDIARVLPFMLHGGGGRLASEIAALLTNGSVRGLRLGVPVNWFTEKVDQHVLANWQAALGQFEALGCQLVPLPRIEVEPFHEAGWAILQSELASLHAARLDRAELFDPGLLHRLKNGLGYSARDYGEALQRRSEALHAFLTAMRDIDAVITPGLGGEAGHLDDLTVDIDGERHAFQTVISRNTMIFDVTGLPALMVPSGVGSTGLPTGIQIVGHPGGDALCLRLGHAFQEVTDFHWMMPPEDAL
ncbi:amidase [Rhizobium sp. WL3]|uniref:amidase n=1 Tax=Rhizobium sp. WL3 TaxID=2603277 RepID=UPI001AEDF058|nr:amidase [Rhizobium sp. WL3]